jgi:hypothetical protein
VSAAQALLDRGYGKPQQSVEVRTIRSFADLTDEELATLAALATDEAESARVHH